LACASSDATRLVAITATTAAAPIRFANDLESFLKGTVCEAVISKSSVKTMV
jgi:hypothetical protein